MQAEFTACVEKISQDLQIVAKTSEEIEIERNKLIKSINQTMKAMTSHSQTSERQLQPFLGFEDKFQKIDDDLLQSRELHLMSKADMESRALILTDEENLLKDAVAPYKILFSDYLKIMTANKDETSAILAALKIRGNKLRLAMIAKENLRRKVESLKSNTATTEGRIRELAEQIRTSRENHVRYDGLIAAFQEQIDDLERRK
jgi:hypothetical protein